VTEVQREETLIHEKKREKGWQVYGTCPTQGNRCHFLSAIS